MASVLIIDDDPLFRRVLERSLQTHGYEIDAVESGLSGLECLTRLRPDIVMLDLKLEHGMDGIETLERIKGMHPNLPVVMMTGFGTVESAVEAMKLGAIDYVQKPLNIDEVVLLVERSIELASLRREVRHLRQYQAQRRRAFPLVVVSQVMQETMDRARVISRSDCTEVLITGANGTGKELLADLIHLESQRHLYPFIAINCYNRSVEEIDTELWGTAGPHQVQSRFELAHRGTVYLNGITQLDRVRQDRLLRLLEERRLNDPSPGFRLDVRLIAADREEDIAGRVASGDFSPALYRRLSIHHLHLPALAARPQDIVPLAEAFMRCCNAEAGKGFIRIAPEAQRLLRDYHWPGNDRQLRNIIGTIVLLEDGHTIQVRHLQAQLAALDAAADTPAQWMGRLTEGLEDGEVYTGVMRSLLQCALERFNGNQTRAGKWLGLSRSRLAYRLRQYGINGKDFGAAP